MKSFKSLYKGLVLGLSLSILGLGSVYCGGSSGGSSGGGTKPTLNVWLQNPPANNAYYRTDPVCIDGTVSGTKDFGWDPNLSVGFNGLVGKLNGCFTLAKDSPLTEQYLDAYAGSVEKSVKFTPLDNPLVAEIICGGGFVRDDLPFDASGSDDVDNAIISYSFNWGDGTPDYIETNSVSPDGAFDGRTTHMYTSSGLKIVTLTVVNNQVPSVSTQKTCQAPVN